MLVVMPLPSASSDHKTNVVRDPNHSDQATDANTSRLENNNINENNNNTKIQKFNADQSNVSSRWFTTLLFITALVIFVAALTCLLCLPSIMSRIISQKLVLRNGSLLLDRYTKPDVPFLFKVWFFDVTNAQQVIDGQNVKPVLKEIGPFVFIMRRRKDVLKFTNDSLYYTEKKVYHFQRELSCCAIDTLITVPNIPLMAVVDKALSYNVPLVGRFIPRLVNRAVGTLRERVFVKRTAGELLFDGYDVPLLRMVSRVGALVGMPQTNQKFGLFKNRNDTWRPEQDGVWGINTGERDPRQFARVVSWNSYKRLPFYSETGCNTINGTDGSLFAPPISAKQSLWIFNNELCRSVIMMFDRQSNVNGINTLRYVLDPINYAPTMDSPSPSSSSSLLNRQSNQSILSSRSGGSTTNETTTATVEQQSTNKLNPLKCFCERKTTNLSGVNICQFNGLFDISKCSKQAQVVFGSMPHFHNGDQRLLAQVHGLKPNESRHSSYLEVEPNVGIVLSGKRRFQLNVLMKHNLEIDGFQNLADMLVPVLWIEESAKISEEGAAKFRTMFTDRVRAANWVLGSALVAAIVLMLIDFRLIAKQSSSLLFVKRLKGTTKKNFNLHKVQQQQRLQHSDLNEMTVIGGAEAAKTGAAVMAPPPASAPPMS